MRSYAEFSVNVLEEIFKFEREKNKTNRVLSLFIGRPQRNNFELFNLDGTFKRCDCFVFG